MFCRFLFKLHFYNLECDGVLHDRCYKAFPELLTWYQAKESCIQQGGGLVEVCDSETNNLLIQIMTSLGRFMKTYNCNKFSL